MQCIVPGCDFDFRCTATSEGVTLLRFPTDPKLCETWLNSLQRKGWQLTEDSAVCSKHFYKDDLLLARDGQRSVRAGVIPVICLPNKSDKQLLPRDVKVCRICFATDCKLYSMIKHKLDEAYEALTGLIVEHNDNIPLYLCTECSRRILNCSRFRTRIIQANLILQDIVQNNEYLTIEAIKSYNGYRHLISTLGVTHKQHYDLEIEHVEKENAGGQINDSSNFYDVSVIKVEKDDMENQENLKDQDATYTSMFPPRLHEVIVPGIKLEKDDTYSQDSREHTTSYKDMGLQDTVGIKVKVETIEAPGQDCVDNDGHNYGQANLGEDYSSDDGLSLGEQAQGDKLTRKVKKVSKYSDKPTVDVHLVPSAESAEMNVVDDKLPRETSIKYQPQRENKSLKQLHANDDANPFDNSKNVKTAKCSKMFEYSCDICKKSFTRKHNLQLHLRSHFGDKPYSCEVCSNAFPTKHKLLIHLRSHSGEKPYKCPECKKSFSQKGNLSIHLRIHSGEKPYSCSVCMKSFAQKTNLDKHFKIHSGEKSYLCEVCNEAFMQLDHFESHLRTHFGEQSYSCKICKKLFRMKCNLVAHLRTHSY